MTGEHDMFITIVDLWLSTLLQTTFTSMVLGRQATLTDHRHIEIEKYRTTTTNTERVPYVTKFSCVQMEATDKIFDEDKPRSAGAAVGAPVEVECLLLLQLAGPTKMLEIVSKIRISKLLFYYSCCCRYL